MSSILSAQNLHTLRRRNIGRRCPCCLSPVFLSAPRPRPPVRFCPNGTLHLHAVETVVVHVFDLSGGASLARLPLRRQAALHAPALRIGLALAPRAIDHFLLL